MSHKRREGLARKPGKPKVDQSFNSEPNYNVTAPSMIVSTLEPPFEIVKSLPITVEAIEDGFVASFREANVNASGDSWDEAVQNLKYMIVDLFEELLSEGPTALGPGPRRQLEVMSSYIALRINVWDWQTVHLVVMTGSTWMIESRLASTASSSLAEVSSHSSTLSRQSTACIVTTK